MSFRDFESKEILVIPTSVNIIKHTAFADMKDFRMYIPSTVEIEELAFLNCNGIIYTDAKEFPKHWYGITERHIELGVIKIIYDTKLKDVQ